jgi:hypothetical protein
MAAAGFPADTVDQLVAATNALNDAIVKREPMRTNRVQSTGSIDKLIAQGRDGVRKINAVLAKRLVADAPALASWRSASRVDAKQGAVRKPAVAPVKITPVATTPATTTPAAVTPTATPAAVTPTATPAAVTPVTTVPAVQAPVAVTPVTTPVATK